MSNDALLEVRDLRVEFSTRRGRAAVLNGVDFQMRGGETLCVVGENSVTTTIANSSAGSTWKNSVRRISAASTLPP